MFSTTILVAAFFAATSVLASPVIEGRQLVQNVKICSNAGLADCDDIPFNFGHCVGNVGRLNDKVSSLDSNGYRCIFYKQVIGKSTSTASILTVLRSDTGCRSGGGQISTSGKIDNIRTDAAHSAQNDDVSSFLCNI